MTDDEINHYGRMIRQAATMTPTPSAAPAEPSKRHNESYEQGWSDGFDIGRAGAPKGEPTAERGTTVSILRVIRQSNMLYAHEKQALTEAIAAVAAQPSPTMADAKNMRALSAEAQARLESIRVPLPTAEERKAQSDAIERVRDKALGGNAECEICKQPCTGRWCSRCLSANPEADAIAAGEPTDEEIARAVRPLYQSDRAASLGLEDDIRTARIVLTLRASSAGTPHGAREPSKDAKDAARYRHLQNHSRLLHIIISMAPHSWNDAIDGDAAGIGQSAKEKP